MSITLDGIKYRAGNRSGHVFMTSCDRCGKFQMELVDLRSKNPAGIQPIYGLQCKACKILHIGNAELQRRGPELFNSPRKCTSPRTLSSEPWKQILKEKVREW